MNTIEALLGNQAKGVLQQVGQQFGVDESQATSAFGALLPALAAGFHRNASNSSGLDALLGALGKGGHQRYLDDVQSLGHGDTAQDGNGILGHIFGSKDVSREVAQRASVQSSVGADVLKKMLPVAAAAMMGALAKRQFGTAVAQADVASRGVPATGGGLLDVLAPMMDRGRDGSMVDDVVGMIGKYMG